MSATSPIATAVPMKDSRFISDLLQLESRAGVVAIAIASVTTPTLRPFHLRYTVSQCCRGRGSPQRDVERDGRRAAGGEARLAGSSISIACESAGAATRDSGRAGSGRTADTGAPQD